MKKVPIVVVIATDVSDSIVTDVACFIIISCCWLNTALLVHMVIFRIDNNPLPYNSTFSSIIVVSKLL